MADVTDRFQVKFWNNAYECKGRFPDGTSFTLKDRNDLTYRQWQEKIKTAYDAHMEPVPEPDECVCPHCKKTFVCENNPLRIR